ncbi:WhiB family transcriptional regulator [Streptomyces sp. NPDC056069]|uniref:WhiB family transcriptional regulator n=1 Tax=Streptomyces sp. NPDC056069 TaxID=3345702 RepID=UPI0035D95BAF
MSDRGTSTTKAPDWRQSAACRSVEPDDMFPAPGYKPGIERAKNVCLGCPVRRQCLDATLAIEGGITKDNRYGIAGGLTPSQRYAEYTRRRKATA